MGNSVSPFERFLALFARVQAEAGGDRNRLRTFYSQKASLKEATGNLMQYVYFSDFKRRLLDGQKKWHPQVPSAFLDQWQEFDANWAEALWDVWFPIDLTSLGLEPSTEEVRGPQPGDGPTKSALESPDPEEEDTFDPLNHEGGAALDMAFWATQSYADDVGGDFENTISRASRIGLGAYDYLENTIGFDVGAVFRRWNQVPVIYFPAHVSNKHGLKEHGSIYELIDDAARAYVFGAPAAAIAMCRAVLEQILKNHYDLELERAKKGHVLQGLGKLIIMADKKYDFVDRRQLETLTSEANAIMHSVDLASRTQDPTVDATIVEFLNTLKFLIQKAPK